MTDPTEARRLSFDRDAERYDAARPSYPEAIVDHVLGATSASYLVEVGAGTGKATELFARRECSIVAIEPGGNMAAVLRKKLAPYPNVTIAPTTFEAWPIEACDLVYSAQAWHWVDPTKRYLKAARAAPALAVISNRKAPLDPELRAALDAAYARLPAGSADDHDEVETWKRDEIASIDRSKLYEPVDVATFPWTRVYTTREYIALLQTYSDHATLEAAQSRALYDAITAALDQRGGTITIPYVTVVLVAQRR